MEGNRKKLRAVLVFGAPGSGKTTFAEKFARKFNLAYYNLDEIQDGYGFTHEAVLSILEIITKAKQSIVIEGGLKTEQDRTEIRNILRAQNYKPTLVWVQTDFTTIKVRLKSKYKTIRKAKEVYDAAIAEMETPADFEKPVILSGKHTFDTQTKHVLAGLAKAR
ncbi:ATP-binding protein [Candidatus Saccharibacteria bacterium]|nr:ATP-binding protein [Candidatus Saccharibacteria bacterium]